MFESGWSRGDILTAVGIGVAIVAGAGAMFTPQFQDWWKRRGQGEPSLLLDLRDAMPYEQAMAPGVARAAALTLAEIAESLPDSRMVWLHEQDFGNSFRWRSVEFLETFIWQPEVPGREFLDQELETLRVILLSSAKAFMHLVGRNTRDLHAGGGDDLRRVPDHYGGHYNEPVFFQKAREINTAADEVWNAYEKLVRRARVKLAHSDIDQESQ